MAGLIVSGYANDGLGALAIYAADIGHYFELEGKAAHAKAEAEKVRREKARTKKATSDKEENTGQHWTVAVLWRNLLLLVAALGAELPLLRLTQRSDSQAVPLAAQN